jgi:GT2 family glycosyltransferase
MRKGVIRIPLYNQFSYTKALINDIGRCIKTEDYEVILIDNASEDETKDFFTDIDFVKDMCKIPNLEYYRQNENIFVNPARNL